MLATLFLSVSLAADPLPIRLPELAVPTPMPRPASAVSKLASDEWYIVDSDVPVLVLASPEGIVTVSEDSGPVKIRGKFADGAGKVESRTYKGKSVFTVEAVQTGRVEILIVPVGGDAKSVIRRTLDVSSNVGPRPPPDPTPDPKPTPTPAPYTGKFSMVVIEETDVAANNRGQFFADKELRDYLATKLVGKPRIADKDVVDASGQPPKDLAPYLNHAKGKGLPQLYLIAPDGTVLYEGDLPKTPAELIATVKKVGG